MAGGAALAHGIMLEGERPALFGMAFKTSFVLRKQRRASRGEGPAFVRRVALDASHLAFQNGVVIGEIELRPHVIMTIEADRFPGSRRVFRDARNQTRRLRASGPEAIGRFNFTP